MPLRSKGNLLTSQGVTRHVMMRDLKYAVLLLLED